MQNRLAPTDADDRFSPFIREAKLSTIRSPGAVDTSVLAELLADCAVPGETLIIGITGSVAVGKTTLCRGIVDHLRSTQRIEVISTDGFLLPNSQLESRGLSLRKGFPESYDTALMSGVLQRARYGAVRVPGYSHELYDRAVELDRTIERPDILLVEGLGLASGPGQRNPSALLDILIYVDAAEEDLEAWFVRRFVEFWRDAETNPASFYARFRTMAEPEAETFARAVWAGINLPNLRDHISLARDHADILLRKSPDHGLQMVRATRAAPN